MTDIMTPPAAVPGKAARLVSRILGKTIDVCILGLAALMPVWFLPITLDIVELNKQTLLVVLTMVAILAWIGKALLDKSFSLTRSWLHLAVVAFLAGYLVVSLFSLDRYISFVGNVGQMQWAFGTIAAFVLLYAVIVNRFRTSGRVYDALLWFLLGSLAAGVYGLLQMFGVFAFGGGGSIGVKTFNSVGTINALGTFMVIPTVIASSLVLYGCTDNECALGKPGKLALFWKIVSYAMIAVGLAIALIIDFWPIWASLIFGMVAMSAIPFIRDRKACRPKTIVLPVLIIVLSVVFLIYKTPINLGIPSEVAPSATHSFQIAQGVLRDAPLFGTGPGTWLFDYAKYRSVGVNVSQFWTVRFERGISTILTLPGMIGIVGITLWLLLIVSGIVKGSSFLVKKRDCAEWHAGATVGAAWLTTVFLAFVYNYNLAHHFAFWFLLALLGVLVSEREFVWGERTKPWLMGVLSSALIIVGVGAVSVTWVSAQRLIADAQYSSAVTSFSRGDGIETTIAHLQSAIALNKLNDVYPRNLSQAYLVKVGRALQGQPTEEAMKKVNDDVAKAVEAAKTATAIGPANVDNWSNLAIVYQSISSFTRGADEFAISNYQEALKREPNNPVFMNEIGKLYVLRSDAYATLLKSPDQKTRTDAETNVKAELDKALDWFNKAVTTKPDYADAHYDLGLVYERQGKLQDAIAKFEELLRTTPNDANTAFQLATLYYRDGKKDESRALFEQIVISNPDYANARWFLASIYEEEKKYDLAIEQVNAIAKTNPDNAQVKAKLDQLAKEKAAPAAPATPPAPAPLPQAIQTPGQNPIKR
jgi:tetratricopeptide (TPR) repeat protein